MGFVSPERRSVPGIVEPVVWQQGVQGAGDDVAGLQQEQRRGRHRKQPCHPEHLASPGRAEAAHGRGEVHGAWRGAGRRGPPAAARGLLVLLFYRDILEPEADGQYTTDVCVRLKPQAEQ